MCLAGGRGGDGDGDGPGEVILQMEERSHLAELHSSFTRLVSQGTIGWVGAHAPVWQG